MRLTFYCIHYLYITNAKSKQENTTFLLITQNYKFKILKI